jgi:Outer membrane efflux protein
VIRWSTFRLKRQASLPSPEWPFPDRIVAECRSEEVLTDYPRTRENARLTENQFKEGVSLASQRDATQAQAMKAQARLLEASLDYLMSRDELNRVLGASAK